jgi:hypothetical protein
MLFGTIKFVCTSLMPSGIVSPPFDLTELGTFAKDSEEVSPVFDHLTSSYPQDDLFVFSACMCRVLMLLLLPSASLCRTSVVSGCACATSV